MLQLPRLELSNVNCCQWILVLAIILSSSPKFSLADEGKAEPTANEVLTIGSHAPQLDIEHWVSNGEGKFKKVTTFEKDKIYVVEFWATWCGPCISSMPHIVSMQKDYAESGVQIVSVSNEDLETVQKFLERKVPNATEEKTYGELTKTYCLTTDPDGSTSKDYMRAAGQNGIPCAFIVGKSGLIEWIGHPMSMDKTLASIVDNKWDREAFAVAFKQEQKFELSMAEIGTLVRAKRIDEAVELAQKLDTSGNKQLEEQKTQIMVSLFVTANRHAEALTLIDKMLAANPEDPSRLLFYKVRALVSMDGKEAETVDLVKTLCQDEKQSTSLKMNLISLLSTNIISGKLVKPETVKTTKELAAETLANLKGESAIGLLVSMSALAAHDNDKEGAVAHLQQAVKLNSNPRVDNILKQKLKLLEADAPDESEDKSSK